MVWKVDIGHGTVLMEEWTLVLWDGLLAGWWCGWQVGRLFGWLGELLADCLVGLLVGRFLGRLVGLLAGRLGIWIVDYVAGWISWLGWLFVAERSTRARRASLS